MESMIEEREELMVPLSSLTAPTLKNAHFLKPILDSRNQPLPKPPSFLLSSKFNIKQLNTRVAFQESPMPQESWHLWVGNLQETHRSTWMKVGIFDAIRASTYNLMRDNELIFRLAQNWCTEANTFVFPWGECTVTLEDVMILGGFSVFGSSVKTPFQNTDFQELGNLLISVFPRNARNRINHSDLMDYFIDIGGELEHMAFLALWLSRFVFSTDDYCDISLYVNVMPIAIALARGTKIALAPAVLAFIYGDLSLLKEKIVERDCNVSKNLILFAPFHIVQLWAWERFPTLCPKPITLFPGEPRLARWQNLEKLKDKSSITEFETLGEGFLWRPYALPVENWEFPEFYTDEERLVLLNSDVSDEFFIFARCLRSCELVGLDCIEQYLPHRVARQFGLDQDIPSSIPRLNGSVELAWSTYDIPLDGVMLYLSPRFFKGDVSVGYLDWLRSPFNHSSTSSLVFKRQHNLSNLSISKLNQKQLKSIGEVEDDNTEFSLKCLTSSCNVQQLKNHFDYSENSQYQTLYEVPITICHDLDGLTEHNTKGVPCRFTPPPSCHVSVLFPNFVEVPITTSFELNTEMCIETTFFSKNVSPSVSLTSPMTEKNKLSQEFDGSGKISNQEALPYLCSLNAAMASGLISSISEMSNETNQSSGKNILKNCIDEEAMPFPSSKLDIKKVVCGIDSQIENQENCEEQCGNNMSGNKRARSVAETNNEAIPSCDKSISPSKSHDNSCQGIPSQSTQMVVVNDVVSSMNSTMEDTSNKLSRGAQPPIKALTTDDENVTKVERLMEPDDKKKFFEVTANDEDGQAAKYGNLNLQNGSVNEPVIINDDDDDNDDEDDNNDDVDPFVERDSELEGRICKLESIICKLRAVKLKTKAY